MSDAAAALVHRLYAAITSGDERELDAVLAEGYVDHEPAPGGLPPTRDGAKALVALLHAAFRDFRIEAEEVITDGDRAASRARLTGTHTGDLLDIPPSGNAISVSAIDWYRIEDGRIAEHWGITDSATLTAQLGAL